MADAGRGAFAGMGWGFAGSPLVVGNLVNAAGAIKLTDGTINAVEVWLVHHFSGEDRLPVLGLHVHPLKGGSVSIAELAAHYYAVERSHASPTSS